MITKVLVFLVRLYQRSEPTRDILMRSLHLPRHMCKHVPSCSENMVIQIKKRGPLIGTLKGLSQLLSCA